MPHAMSSWSALERQNSGVTAPAFSTQLDERTRTRDVTSPSLTSFILPMRALVRINEHTSGLGPPPRTWEVLSESWFGLLCY